MSDNRSKYPKMNPEIKELWLEALRSGNYPQGIGALKEIKLGEEIYRYCCLGVLCETIIAKGIMDIPVRAESNLVTFDGVIGGLTSRLMDKVGLTRDAHGELVRLNDLKRLSFSEIADWIEENL